MVGPGGADGVKRPWAVRFSVMPAMTADRAQLKEIDFNTRIG